MGRDVTISQKVEKLVRSWNLQLGTSWIHQDLQQLPYLDSYLKEFVNPTILFYFALNLMRWQLEMMTIHHW